jgi:transcriptional regulator with XRE-family HTH domain
MGKVGNYLRFYRRRWHLTQEELAFLFGYEEQSIIVRLEQQEREATLVVVHACALIFGVKPREVFPALFESIEERLLARIYELQERLTRSTPSQKTLANLELLHEAIGRIAGSQEQEA